MELGINYEEAQKLVDKHISDKITRLHLLETEAIMGDLAEKFGENKEEWSIIGLLHDIDWDLTKSNTGEHCVKAVEILKEAGASDFLIETVISHGYGHDSIPAYINKQRQSKLQHSLCAAETLTGLIIASALVQPDIKLASVKLESLKKKFKQKSFAANCDRELIRECEQAGVPLDEFLELSLKSLQKISDKIGL